MPFQRLDISGILRGLENRGQLALQKRQRREIRDAAMLQLLGAGAGFAVGGPQGAAFGTSAANLLGPRPSPTQAINLGLQGFQMGEQAEAKELLAAREAQNEAARQEALLLARGQPGEQLFDPFGDLTKERLPGTPPDLDAAAIALLGGPDTAGAGFQGAIALAGQQATAGRAAAERATRVLEGGLNRDLKRELHQSGFKNKAENLDLNKKFQRELFELKAVLKRELKQTDINAAKSLFLDKAKLKKEIEATKISKSGESTDKLLARLLKKNAAAPAGGPELTDEEANIVDRISKINAKSALITKITDTGFQPFRKSRAKTVELGKNQASPHPQPTTQGEFDNIPTGEWFIDGDGKVKKKL